VTILVLDVPSTDPGTLAWAKAKKVKKRFKKKCPQCRVYNRSSRKDCRRCGFVFPIPPKRRHKFLE
jgi:hypothetical protein